MFCNKTRIVRNQIDTITASIVQIIKNKMIKYTFVLIGAAEIDRNLFCYKKKYEIKTSI